MIQPNTIPDERPLPAERHQRMRGELLRATARGRATPGRHRWRLVAATGMAVVAAAALAVATTGLPFGSERGTPEVFALGDEALTQLVRDTGNLCLTHARDKDPEQWPADLRPTMWNYAERGDEAVVIYDAAGRLVMCTMGPTVPPSDELSSSLHIANQDPDPSLLPGPFIADSVLSEQANGGRVNMAGRVSARVEKVVLEGGAKPVQARVQRGTFALVSSGDVRLDRAVLVAYDHSGQVVDRRPFPATRRTIADRCYTAPDGTVVFGTSNGACQPAEAWQPES